MLSTIQFRTPFCSYSLKVIGALALISLFSCNTDPKNRPSPLRKDVGIVGKTNVSIEYSSPGVKGREIFGYGNDFLVPYNEFWRTGANDATFITFDQPVKVDSFRFEIGSYSIFSIPGKETWTIIFNSEWKQWGPYNYQDSLDVARIVVPIVPIDSIQENMRFFIENDSLKFKWEKTSWGIRLSNLP